MANTYYLVTAGQAEEATAYAITSGPSHGLFQIRWNNDRTKAIIQAEWIRTPPGVYLGAYLNGPAEKLVYNELENPEWNPADDV